MRCAHRRGFEQTRERAEECEGGEDTAKHALVLPLLLNMARCSSSFPPFFSMDGSKPVLV